MTTAPTPLHGRHAPRSQLVLGAIALVALTALGMTLLVDRHVFGSSSSSSGIQGSGVAATQTRDLSPFSSLALAGSNNVTVRVGGKQSVVVHADDNLLGHVTTRVRAGNLVIGNTSESFTTRSAMSVEVSVPTLQALALTGSGNISATGIETPSLTVTLSGSGTLRADGSATRLDVTVPGSGNAQLEQLAARNVHAVVSGSGLIIATATGTLDASIPGSGTIVYGGNPAHVATSITGSGAVVRG